MIQTFTFSNPDIEFSLELHSGNELVSAMMAATGEWEPVESAIVTTVLRHGDHFIDVGANIGYYSILASRCVGAAGSVISLEPDRKNHELLSKNIARNGCRNITPLNSAAGAETGEIKLFRNSDNYGDHCTYPQKKS